MIIKYYGHACFTVKDKNLKIVIDPFGDIGYKQEFINANVCLCSHLHYDHCSLDGVKVDKVISENSASNCEFVTIINSFHDEVLGKKRGNNRIYKFTMDEITLCHMGDLGMPFSQELVNEIGQTDVLLIPIGGNYTINCEEAEKYVRAINPKIVIPMHYKTKNSNIDIDEKDTFLNRFNKVEKRPREFEINGDALKGEGITVIDIQDGDF